MARLPGPTRPGRRCRADLVVVAEMVTVVNRLLDAAYNKSILATRIREAALMRIAQLNDCTVCLAFRADTVRAQ